MEKVKYTKTIYYSVYCPICGEITEISNPYRLDLTGEEIECDNCGAKLEIIGEEE